MIGRCARVLGAVLALAAVLPALAPAQEAEWKISHPEVFGSLGRPAVRFPHAVHSALDGVTCLACHHVFEKGKNVLDPDTLKPGDESPRCAACHVKPLDLEKSYHLLCIGCHTTARKVFGVTGPRECGECHRGKVIGEEAW